MRTCFAILTLSLLLAGCTEPTFTHRGEYSQLDPMGQQYVDVVLGNYFGTPTEMVVWDKLPLQLHLAQATVVSAADRELKLQLADPNVQIAAGTEVLWTNADGSQSQSNWIRSFDADTQAAELENRLTGELAAGTPVILGPGEVLVRGRHLYAEHCQHCHGVSGDGEGPTAKYLNPKPRDYRKGVFKFTVTQATDRAARSDLHRTILDGIPGTYMPSFKLLTDDELTAITEYVLWLSMRGEVEYKLVRLLSTMVSNQQVQERMQKGESYQAIRTEFEGLVNDPNELKSEFDLIIELLVEGWTKANTPEALIAPKTARVPYSAESIARGRELYLNSNQNCAACHGEAGYGDGPQTYSITKDAETNLDNPEPGLFDTWGNKLEPRNLHTGIYRGGRRPIDLYSRISAGIKGTPMPAFGAKLEDEKIWDLVNYIYSVPFEDRLPATVNPHPGGESAGEVAAN